MSNLEGEDENVDGRGGAGVQDVHDDVHFGGDNCLICYFNDVTYNLEVDESPGWLTVPTKLGWTPVSQTCGAVPTQEGPSNRYHVLTEKEEQSNSGNGTTFASPEPTKRSLGSVAQIRFASEALPQKMRKIQEASRASTKGGPLVEKFTTNGRSKGQHQQPTERANDKLNNQRREPTTISTTNGGNQRQHQQPTEGANDNIDSKWKKPTTTSTANGGSQ